MPEASITEHCQTELRERDVDTPPRARNSRVVDAKP